MPCEYYHHFLGVPWHEGWELWQRTWHRPNNLARLLLAICPSKIITAQHPPKSGQRQWKRRNWERRGDLKSGIVVERSSWDSCESLKLNRSQIKLIVFPAPPLAPNEATNPVYFQLLSLGQTVTSSPRTTPSIALTPQGQTLPSRPQNLSSELSPWLPSYQQPLVPPEPKWPFHSHWSDHVPLALWVTVTSGWIQTLQCATQGLSHFFSLISLNTLKDLITSIFYTPRILYISFSFLGCTFPILLQVRSYFPSKHSKFLYTPTALYCVL